MQAADATARAAQARADAAQRARMQARLGTPGQSGKTKNAVPGGHADSSDETPAQRSERQAVQAQLQRVQDDPGGLLRQRFMLEYRRRLDQGETPGDAPP